MGAGRFDGQVVIVTGAASGIGRAAANRFAKDGATVVAADINAVGLETTVKSITDAGGTAAAHVFDVRDQDQCKDLVAKTIAVHGKLNVLCNIAGIWTIKHCEDEDAATWNNIMATNATGPFYLSQAALPHLLRERGNIVNIASTAGVAGHAYMTSYCASKHAIIGLTRSMAVEFGHQGLRVNAICPGGVNTPIAKNVPFPKKAVPDLLSRVQLHPAVAEPEDMADVICYTASGEAKFVNGAVICADNGATAA
jgi:meso-butanediol dehydrogenase/(S,S)-butanediol dehydrogenase/diacetyl reductase